MPAFRLPLSGNVTADNQPVELVLQSGRQCQVGLVNIDLGRSSNPAVEEEVLTGSGELRQAARADRGCAAGSARPFPAGAPSDER